MKQIIGKQTIELEVGALNGFCSKYSRCVVELGAGDGKFAYNLAKEHPESAVIAIDADRSQFADISFKASRKPAKGGLENIVFIWSAVEYLSTQLRSLADEVYVNFPWGTLLSGVAKADSQMLTTISGIVKPEGKLTITFSYDTQLEPQTVEQYKLPEISEAGIDALIEKYKDFGLVLNSKQIFQSLDDLEVYTGSWAKSLRSHRTRVVVRLEFIK